MTRKKLATLTLFIASTIIASASAFNDTTDVDSVTYVLDEVVVRANPRVTTLKGDALLTRVSGTPLEHAGTANDVLKQVPMVLGSDGNFEVFGKGAPAIYVNGRQLQDASELAQISSANIKNVEVLTNPGAKYNAATKAVINISLKAPQGDGLSGLIRAQGAAQKFGRTSEQLNLKYRTGALEVFGNFGYFGGKHEDAATNRMLTRSSMLWDQTLDQNGYAKIHDFYGKVGFSYLLNARHSLGAYYLNGIKKTSARYTGESRLLADGIHYDDLSVKIRQNSTTTPKHHANLYYSGIVANLGIDFNMDYLWRKDRSDMSNDETSGNFDNDLVSSSTVNRSHLFAEKLVLSHPLWKGRIEIGEEYTASRFSTSYLTDAAALTSADTRVDENNIAAFAQLAQRFGIWNLSAGLRYEHVTFNYHDNGLRRDDMTRRYNNIFPSLSLSTMVDKVRMAFSYTHKTQRPSYSDLDGTIDYINRFTFEGGNPYLKPEKIHNVEFMATWGPLFGQLSYSYKKDPIMYTTVPYGHDGEVKLITKANYPHIQQLQAFLGGQFQFGIWQPKVNLGIIKQWFTITYNGAHMALDNPIGLIQFQNALHLPADIWLNIDLQWMSAGNGENGKISASSYVNAKLYKAFLNNRLSLSLEANDIFNKSNRNVTFYNSDVTLYKTLHTTTRTFQLTIQYTFNTTRDRYKGQGAGNTEKTRF